MSASASVQLSDFGYGPIETLARVADPAPAPDHSAFWSRWEKRVHETRPRLVERSRDGVGGRAIDPSDETATHAFTSLGVRIGGRLLLPPAGVPIRAGLVSTHGYAASLPLAERDGLFAGAIERGVAVLNIRVRGFAGSRLDCGDLTQPTEPGLGWITHGLDEEGEPPACDGWTWPGAVADVFNACRALQWWLAEKLEIPEGERAPLYLHGESFGGGLAVAAAAMLPGRPGAKTSVDRLALALPTMGDWPWRLSEPGRAGAGSGTEVATLIERRPELAETIRARLRFMDAVVLAREVRCPVLCKLALRDEVVPAPTAAAVFNALGVDPGLKWRFVVPAGHAEVGLANARRHAAFERCAVDFLDPGAEPARTMAEWEDRLLDADEQTPAGAGGETGSLFGGASDRDDATEALVSAYQAAGRTLDDLPYTDEYEQLWSTVAKATRLDRRGVFHKLHNLRKAGKLPKMGRAATKPTRLEPEEESALAEMVVGAVGTLGQRDRLPYTGDFDRLREAFNERTGRTLTQHDLWRVIAKLAK